MSRSVLVATSSTLSAGGIGSFCVILIESLRRQGLKPIVVSPPIALDKSWRQFGAEAEYSIGPEVDPAVAIRQIHEIRSRHDCFGILNNDHPYVQSYSTVSEVPVISICHFETGAIGRLAVENAKSVDYVVAISEDMRDTLHSSKCIQRGQVPVVHTGVRCLPNRAQSPSERGGAIFLGGGDKRKGADLVEQLALRLDGSQAVPPIDWYGQVSSRQFRRLSQLSSVRLMGHQPRVEVLRALSQARFLLFPSRAEGCPMALLEGMEMGVVPICALGRGAMREIVRDGADGYIFPVDDWVNGAHHILAGGVASEFWVKLSAAAREKVRDYFDIDHKASQLIKLLESPRVSRPLDHEVRTVFWHRNRRRLLPIGLIDTLRFRLGILRRGPIASLDLL